MASQEHDSAVRRLEAALVEQDRLGERFDTAVGTSTELLLAERRAQSEMQRPDGDHRVGQIIKARRAVARPRVGDRASLNGREVGPRTCSTTSFSVA